MSKDLIITERLILRPFQQEDVEDSLAYRNDAEFGRYLPHIPFPFARKDAEEFVRVNMAEPWEKCPTFAIVFEGKVIGTVNLEIDAEAASAMIGYAIGTSYWGRGIAAEAARAVMGWAFREHSLERIWASTHLENTRSKRVLEKLGMRLRRVEREAVYEIGRTGS